MCRNVTKREASFKNKKQKKYILFRKVKKKSYNLKILKICWGSYKKKKKRKKVCVVVGGGGIQKLISVHLLATISELQPYSVLRYC